MSDFQELPIPPEVKAENRGIELARVWAAGGKQHVALATQLWSDPAAWGIMLVDLARHVAAAYEQTEGRAPVEVLAKIKAGFDAEWYSATDEIEGGIQE